MGITSRVPENEEEWLKWRHADVTSSEVAALFGLSPYLTKFELWHRKRNPETYKMELGAWAIWGNRLEAAIAEGLAEDNGWNVRNMTEYMRDDILRMGSSFDYAIDDDGILEIKNVFGIVYKDQWIIEDGLIEAPAHIEMQVQHQLGCSGRKYAYIGALVSGNSPVVIKRARNEDIIEKIKFEIGQFWQTIDADQEPSPDFAQDYEFISQIHSHSEPNKVIQGTEAIRDLACRYKEASLRFKQADEDKKAIKAETLTLIGDASKVEGDQFSVTANMVGPCEMAYTRKGYRGFRFNYKKGFEV